MFLCASNVCPGHLVKVCNSIIMKDLKWEDCLAKGRLAHLSTSLLLHLWVIVQAVFSSFRKLVLKFLKLLHDPRLPLNNMNDVMSNISSRIPPDLERLIAKALKNYEQECLEYFLFMSCRPSQISILNQHTKKTLSVPIWAWKCNFSPFWILW